MKLSRILTCLLVFWFAVSVASQTPIYRNHQYGIRLQIPSGTLACMAPVYEGNGADHGVQILLGTKDGSLCSKSSGKRYIDVWAAYNAVEDTKILHDYLEDACESVVKKACSPAPANLHINGLKTEAGRSDRPDGSIEIIVATQAGKPAADFDTSVPSINYEVNLSTDTQNLDNDLKIFRTVLKTIKIAPSRR